MKRFRAVALALLVAGCSSTPAQSGRAVPLSMGPSASATPSSSTASAPTATSLVPFDAMKVTRALDDPRLADAKALVASGKPLEAARSVAKVSESVEPRDRALFSHLEGRLRLAGGDPRGAASAFDRAASIDGPLRFYASLAAAEALTQGDAAAAVTRARAADGHVPAARLDPVLARSLLRSGKVDEGLERLRKAMGPSAKKNPRVALELARALLAHPGEGRAVEALRLATAIDLDAPRTKITDDAKKLVDQARSNVSNEDRKAFEASFGDKPDEVRGARLAVSGQGKRALVILDRLAKKGPLGCTGSAGRADALVQVKRFSEASEEYGHALDACASDPRAGATDDLDARDPAALAFAGARASSKGGDLELAKRRFEKLEMDQKTTRFADDARAERIRIAIDGGDVAAADKLAATIVEDFPTGDMVKDALFSVGMAHAARGDWTGALPSLTRGEGLVADQAYERAGRFSYFRGRALIATRHEDEGRAELERTVRESPCGYYAALATARLDAMGGAPRPVDPRASEKAEKTVELSASAPVEVLENPSWLAAVELVRADDSDLALVALGDLGVNDRTASPETLGAAAALLARSADPTVAHSLLRSAFEIEARPGRSEFRAFRSVPPSPEATLSFWRIAYPKPFAAEVTRAAEESGVSPSLLYAIMREESAFSPVALSKAGAVGLMQLMPPTARKMSRGLGIKVNDATLRDPGSNVRLGARYLAAMARRFPDDPLLSIPAYNAGPGAPESWTSASPGIDFDLFVEAIPYAETRAYTKRVIASLTAYESIYGDGTSTPGLVIPERARGAP